MASPRFSTRSLLLATALTSLALPVTLPALAQEAVLDEIIVTAQRREQGLQTTPVAVTALTADALADQQITSAEDLTNVVPNLVLMPVTASRSTLQVGLRGGSEQSGGLVTSESAVAFYIDDVYRGRLAGSNLELADIERIEVLRGPQGTLYGRNAFSGAVKIVTRTPGEKQWGEAAIGIGSYDERKASASVGGALMDGALGASLSVLYRDQDGFIHNQALDKDVFGQRNLALRGKLHFYGSDSVKATLIVSRTQDDNDGPANLIPVGWSRTYPTVAADHATTHDARPLAGDAYTSLSPVDPDGYTDQTAVSLDVSAELGGATLRSITAFVRTDDGFLFDMSGGIRDPDGSYRANGLIRDANSDTDQYSQELQLQGDGFGGDLTWIGGLYYFREENKQRFEDILVLGPGFSLPVLPQTIDSTTKSYAAFAQASYQLNERLSVTGGLRYTRDEKKLKGTIQNRLPLSPGPAVALVALERDPSFSSWTPKAGLDFKIAEDLFSYLSVSRGFKAGGFNGLAVANPAVFGTVYGPQTVWAYESGLKATMLDGRLRTNLSVYRNDLSDLQQTIEIGAGSYAVQNIGDARLHGAELEVTFMPVEGLNLFANLGLMDDKYKKLDPLSDAAVAGARHLPLVSPWTVQGGFTYDTPRFWQDRVKLRLSSSYLHQGDYYSTVANLLESKMPGLVSASIALLDGEEGWNVTFGGKNLTNKTYFTTAPSNSAIAVGEPRTWSLTAGYRF